MSAHVVSKTHVDLLVNAALRAGRPNYAGERFRWWEVDENGAYAGWRELDRLGPGEDPAKVTPSQLGQLWLSANVRSVGYRYSEPGRVYYYGAEAAAAMDALADEDLPGAEVRWYVYEHPGYELTAGEVFSAIDCLAYQACEPDDWRQSEAFVALEALRHAWCRRVAGYSDSPWGWEASDVASRRRR